MSQLGLPLLVTGAGLPSLPGLAGEARSYAERLFSYVEVDSLDHDDARRALVEPVEGEGEGWGPDAVEQVIDRTEGYPYFLQEFGKQAWNFADGATITAGDVTASVTLAVDERGLLFAPRHGFLAFTVPMFDQFIRRTLG